RAAEQGVIEVVGSGSRIGPGDGGVERALAQPTDILVEADRVDRGIDASRAQVLRHDLAGGHPIGPASRYAEVEAEAFAAGAHEYAVRAFVESSSLQQRGRLCRVKCEGGVRILVLQVALL